MFKHVQTVLVIVKVTKTAIIYLSIYLFVCLSIYRYVCVCKHSYTQISFVVIVLVYACVKHA